MTNSIKGVVQLEFHGEILYGVTRLKVWGVF